MVLLDTVPKPYGLPKEAFYDTLPIVKGICLLQCKSALSESRLRTGNN